MVRFGGTEFEPTSFDDRDPVIRPVHRPVVDTARKEGEEALSELSQTTAARTPSLDPTGPHRWLLLGVGTVLLAGCQMATPVENADRSRSAANIGLSAEPMPTRLPFSYEEHGEIAPAAADSDRSLAQGSGSRPIDDFEGARDRAREQHTQEHWPTGSSLEPVDPKQAFRSDVTIDRGRNPNDSAPRRGSSEPAVSIKYDNDRKNNSADGADPGSAIEDGLVADQRRLLQDILHWTTKQRALTLAEDLNLQELLVRAIALHQLGVGEERDYREIVHTGFEKVQEPSKRLRFLMAAFYHELGLEGHRDRALTGRGDRLGMGSIENATAARESGEIAPTSLRLEDIEFMFMRRGQQGASEAFDERRLRAGDLVYTRVKTSGLQFARVVEGFRPDVQVDLILSTAKGTQLDAITLGSECEAASDPTVPYLLHFWYQLPSRLTPGKYRIELRITDKLRAADIQAVTSREFELRSQRR